MLQDFFVPREISAYFDIWELLLSLSISFLLCVVIGLIYKKTHRGVSYSQGFVITMVIVGVTVSVIMMIIGSNIARAFTLVGALSIIRFRNAVKDTRDVGFIFLSMAVGMACGTRFYGTAIIFTAFIGGAIFLMYGIDLFARTGVSQILRVQVAQDLDYEQAFRQLFDQSCSSHTLLSLEAVRQGAFTELVYSLELKTAVDARVFLETLRNITGNTKVSLARGDSIDV
ncbi:MAG: putative membrane protein YhiD involved in acid resistance [Planctomycetota bacterium]|jgi:uncharacterized membrane protein YhiD involved in acid resistance